MVDEGVDVMKTSGRMMEDSVVCASAADIAHVWCQLCLCVVAAFLFLYKKI